MNLHDRLKSCLAACDEAALENVRAGKGGPFAASLHVHDARYDRWIDVAGPACNAVLETGIATAHAEDRVIAPENIEKLRAILSVCDKGGVVYVISSAESCPACHAKLEILARHLLNDRLIARNGFRLVYGASYEESRSVAGFNDLAYHEDFQHPPGAGLVRHEYIDRASLPGNIRHALIDGNGPHAVIAADDHIYSGAGPYPECEAIKAACAARKASNLPEPWNLNGGTLYTFTRDIGPLAYAECQWANIARWVTVEGGAQTMEAPGTPNGDLFRVIATRPYTHPDSALDIVRLTPFENRAQHEWALLRENGNVRVYNGAG